MKIEIGKKELQVEVPVWGEYGPHYKFVPAETPALRKIAALRRLHRARTAQAKKIGQRWFSGIIASFFTGNERQTASQGKFPVAGDLVFISRDNSNNQFRMSSPCAPEWAEREVARSGAGWSLDEFVAASIQSDFAADLQSVAEEWRSHAEAANAASHGRHKFPVFCGYGWSSNPLDRLGVKWEDSQ